MRRQQPARTCRRKTSTVPTHQRGRAQVDRKQEVLSRVPTRELEPVNLHFCREKGPFTTCERLRDDISEDGPLAKTPLCFVEVERESVK